MNRYQHIVREAQGNAGTCIPSRGGVAILLVASYLGIHDKLQLGVPAGCSWSTE